VFENRMLRKIFISQMDEVTGLRKNSIMMGFIMCTLQKNIIKMFMSRMRCVGHDMINVYKNLVLNPEK
jgi:hypothetical protein